MMYELTEKDFQKIIARRDKRFDGRFYFGVKTTSIYCRPICPARPKPENILIFRSSTEAEKNGYRPCMRCRPDLAPGFNMLEGTSRSVSRALKIIQELSTDELDVQKLAESLGMSDRHLRRLFDEHLGASPIEVMTTQRLHFAKQLVQESKTPITDIAFASGFQSVRRFNEAFKVHFHKTPSQLRDHSKIISTETILHVPVRQPYDWQTMLAYLTRHETFGLEAVRDNSYHRFVEGEDDFGQISVSFDERKASLEVKFRGIELKRLRHNLARIKSLFDTEHNPAHLPHDKNVHAKGIRVPGSFDSFETAVCIILGQLVSTAHAKTIARRMVQKFGNYIGESTFGPVFTFPSPQILKDAPVEELGVTSVKSHAIRKLAELIDSGEISFDAHDAVADHMEKLANIKGIGPWTVSMIAMRCTNDPDAFPATDLIVQRAMKSKLFEKDSWNSSRAYLTHVLWRDFSEHLSKRKKGKTP